MIVGVTGTNGAGKGTVADYLVQKGFKHYSSRACIVEEIEKRGLPVNRDTMTSVSNDMRAKNGAAIIVETLYNQALKKGGDAVIESVREIPGAAFIKEHGGFMIGVDADQKIRYERAMKRGSATDHIDFDTFVVQEKREMENPDPAKQNIAAVMRIVDATVYNNGTLEELNAQVDSVLEDFKTKERP